MTFKQIFSEENTAWRVVAISAIAVFFIFGIRLSFSVFYAEFTRENGWGNSASASIFSLNMLFFAVSSAPAGILLDRWGPRVMFTTGAILLGVSLYLSSLATEIYQLQLAYGVFGGIALGLIGLGQFAAIVGGWQPEKRGLAIGITFAGTGLGALIFVPLVERLISFFGWQTAYFILAGMCIVFVAPLLALGQRKPPTVAQMAEREADFQPKPRREVLKDPAFWWLMVLSFTTMGPLRMLTVHQIAYMEEVGIGRLTAARYVGIAGFLTTFTFILWGYVSDRYGRTRTFFLGALSLMSAIGILFALQSTNFLLLLFGYSMLMALGEGTRSSQTTALASDTFRESGLGFINGLVGALFGVGAAFAPWIAGYLRDVQGDYALSLMIAILLLLISMVAFYQVKSLKSRKID